MLKWGNVAEVHLLKAPSTFSCENQSRNSLTHEKLWFYNKYTCCRWRLWSWEFICIMYWDCSDWQCCNFCSKSQKS